MGSSEAVCTGISATENYDSLAFCGYPFSIAELLSPINSVLLREVVHREVNTVKLFAGHSKSPGDRGSTSEANRIEFCAEIFHADIHSDVRIGTELDALKAHHLEAAFNDGFLELEVWDTKAEEAADDLVAFEDGDLMACTVELLCGR